MATIGNSFVQMAESMRKIMDHLANVNHSASYSNSSGNFLHHSTNQMFVLFHYLMYLFHTTKFEIFTLLIYSVFAKDMKKYFC